MTDKKKKNVRSGTAGKKGIGKKSQVKKVKDSRLKEEISAVAIMAIGAFLIVALHTDGAGRLGAAISGFLRGMFGLTAHILPYYLILYGVLVIAKKTSQSTGRNIVLMLITYLSLTLINSGRFIVVGKMLTTGYISGAYETGQTLESGGFFGMLFGLIISKLIGIFGLYIFAAVIMIICLMIIINTPISAFIETRKFKKEVKREEKLLQEEMLKKDREEYERQIKEEAKRRAQEKAANISKKNINDFGQQEIKIDGDNITKGQKNIISLVKSENEFGKSGSGDISENPSNKKDKGFLFFGKKKKPDLMEEVLIEEREQDHIDDNNMDSKTNVKKQPTISFGLIDDSIPESSKKGNSFEMTDGNVDSEGEEQIARYNLDNSEIHNSSFKVTSYDNIRDSEMDVEGLKYRKDGRETETEPVKKISKKEAENAFLRKEDFNTGDDLGSYKFPPIDLMEKKKIKSSGNEEQELREKAEKLEETLKNFHVDARVINVTKGPAVTQYEIQPSVGVKVSSIVRLADDIALNLEAKSIRIEAPIPGKAAVGIEVENEKINLVTLREIIDSGEFKKAKSKITFAVGKDISGKAIVADLKGMPHMLIAGSTGSGKSVCINSIIISLIYKARPDEVKLVLIDPKVVELGNYNGIPHLLIPVVTEPTKAAAALNWAVAEMTDRYRKFADYGVRDLDSYNKKKISEGKGEEKLPQIVIIIDELADLMMAAPQQVEDSICRLAQMARAAGMHLIVATQRPSVDIITGVIKANIPSRIAFAVSSQVDSRTILDMGGAEKLVGKGDMLFNPLGKPKPLRVQGSFVSDSEVHNIIQYIKNNSEGSANYADDIISKIDTQTINNITGSNEEDELLKDAIETVVRAGQASVSMLQRRFRIGYNRAARLVEEMEDRNIIGPADGSRPRKVLMTEEQLMTDENSASEELIENEQPSEKEEE